MDVFTIEALVLELAGRVAGARIDKIHQPEPEVLLFRLWARGEEMRLLLSATPGRSRCHLTSGSFANPTSPPRFCQLLRARLAGVTTFEQVPGERIIRIGCRGREGEGYTLIAELLGAHPDLILVDAAGVIVDALRRTGAGVRDNLAGRPYLSPPAPPRIPLQEAERAIPPGETSAGDFERWLLARVAPMSPFVARDLAAGVGEGKTPADVIDRFRCLRLREEFRPMIGLLDGRPVLTPFVPLYLPLEDEQSFGSISEAADVFYALPGLGGSGERRQLAAALRRQRQRLEKRLEHLEAEGEGSGEEVEGTRCHLGDLLMANLHRIERGMTGITVDDLFRYPPEPLFIPLDPRLSPAENAQKHFHRQRKERKGRAHLARRRAETEEEIEWLDGAMLALDEAESAAELAAVRRELEEAGVVAPAPAPSRRRPPLSGGVNRGISPGGFPIIWGKTNYGNDRVSREFTGPDDLWFHAHRMPGCHLVLQRQGRKGEIPEADLLYAAAVAAGYSRGKDAPKIEVMVTEGKHVRRPKGARPGLVTVEHFRTVVVHPLRPHPFDSTPAGEGRAHSNLPFRRRDQR